MMIRVFATTLLAASTLTACASEREVVGYDEGLYQSTEGDIFLENWSEYSNLSVRDPSTFGSMGPVADMSGLASASAYRDGTDDDSFTEVNLVTTNAQGSAMHMLYIEGDLASLERGRTYTFSGDDGYDQSGGAVPVYAMSTNCSGTREPGDWEYDVSADEVSITVTDTEDGDLRVDYETVGQDDLFGDDVSGGSFVLPSEEPADTEF